MFKKFLKKVMLKRKTDLKIRKEVVPAHQLNIHINMLSRAAKEVITKLQKAGFTSCLVGGAVRDMILGVTPKDFDIVTNAKPEEVRNLFKRSKIIGRRFKIVHVYFGREIIEVTTYRGAGKTEYNENGRIIRDNSYGSIEQDAMRRDFTCNALYYDPIAEEILDFHQGIDDTQNRKLVMIGNPSERFQEDPVRMLRAIRFSGKLSFEIDAYSINTIKHYGYLLKNEPVARLFDEFMKLIFSGSAFSCVQQLNFFEIPQNIHPLLDAFKSSGADENIIKLALQNTDIRLKEGKSVSTGFVLAALLWPEVNGYWHHNISAGMKNSHALSSAISMFNEKIESNWGVPHRFSATMREIWIFQAQFHSQKGSSPFKLLSQPRFRAAYDFLLLREELNEVDRNIVNWWRKFQTVDDQTREVMANIKH